MKKELNDIGVSYANLKSSHLPHLSFCDSMNLYNFDGTENLKRTNREHLSDYGKWLYSKFKSVANNTIQKFEDEIRYTIGKAVNDANEEGLLPRTDGRDYYSFSLYILLSVRIFSVSLQKVLNYGH